MRKARATRGLRHGWTLNCAAFVLLVIPSTVASSVETDQVTIPWLRFDPSILGWLDALFVSVGDNVALQDGVVTVSRIDRPNLKAMDRVDATRAALRYGFTGYLLSLPGRMAEANRELGRSECIVKFEPSPYDAYDAQGVVLFKKGAYFGECRECSFLPYKDCNLRVTPARRAYLHVIDTDDIEDIVVAFERDFNNAYDCLNGPLDHYVTRLRTLTTLQIRLSHFVHELEEAFQAYTRKGPANDVLLQKAIAGNLMNQQEARTWRKLLKTRYNLCHRPSVKTAEQVAGLSAHSSSLPQPAGIETAFAKIRYRGLVKWRVTVEVNSDVRFVNLETTRLRVKKPLKGTPLCASD